MKFVRVTTAKGKSIVVNTEAIGLMAPSLKDGASTALYETFEDFIEDEDCECQDRAIHIRESIGYVKDKQLAYYDNEKR